MSSVRGVDSWQDAYIFCLQPNFQDDLWLFMIFAAIQVSLAGLKLTSFFINRWARGSKVGSGDDDEDNVGDDGASGGISIMGVLTLIAGALILAAYCDNEPDEKTFNIFKAGVYLNTFLFAVALIFICGLVVAFVVDIITRRRGRSITFRMFLGGTIVLSIAASFFGATGIMGLKYIQSDCYDEVELYLQSSHDYLKVETKEYAEEAIEGSYVEWTNEDVYKKYGDNIIGQPTMFKEDDQAMTTEPYFVYTAVTRQTATREFILQTVVKTAKYTKSVNLATNIRTIGLTTDSTTVRCFDSATDGFSSYDGLIICPIRYSNTKTEQARYEEATEEIVADGFCANEESEIVCHKDSTSFPLCCTQFDDSYTVGNEDCHCFDAIKDASCGFDELCTTYEKDTLDLSQDKQREQWCDHTFTAGSDPWCVKETINSVNVWAWDRKCDDKTSQDEIFACCDGLSLSEFSRYWTKHGVTRTFLDMTPAKCKTKGVYQCMNKNQYADGCCKDSTHAECTFCTSGPADNTIISETDHASKCGYTTCLAKTHFELKKCCLETEETFDFTFKAGTKCEAAINYKACDDTKPSKNEKSLACSKATTDCNSSKKCFPACCSGLKFDLSTEESTKLSLESDCFKVAPYLLAPLNDKENVIGQYIYHHEHLDCKSNNGIINSKCCNSEHMYHKEDPCYCSYYKPTDNQFDKNLCKKVHIKDCRPQIDTTSQISSAYPQCCYDIGNTLFGIDDFCSCRLNQNPNNPDESCNDGPSEGTKFVPVTNCPNPCKDNKALLPDKSLVCEKPVYEL
jgi:hypothetical protein